MDRWSTSISQLSPPVISSWSPNSSEVLVRGGMLHSHTWLTPSALQNLSGAPPALWRLPQPLPISTPSPVSHLDTSVSLPRWSLQAASCLAHPGGTQPLGGHPGRDCQASAGALIHFMSPVREESLAPISGRNQSCRGRPGRHHPGASHSISPTCAPCLPAL